MEGAAFHYVCLQEGMPFAQVRSISNYVEPRNRSAWKIKEAVIALNEWVVAFLKQQ
jgi:futalosine hydrolase